MIAVIFLLIITIGPYLAFTKHIPFTSYGYEVKATFANGVNISQKLAGPDRRGRSRQSDRASNATATRPRSPSPSTAPAGRSTTDAFAEIRPRIFLEGNFFIELDPGSPSAPEMDSGGTIPVSHTSTAVQLDEILTALQSPVRADLGRLLEGFGTALNAAADRRRRRDPAPRGAGARAAAKRSTACFKYGGDAGRYGAQVTNAFLGTSPARPLAR